MSPVTQKWRNIIAVYVATLLGSALIYFGTDGLRAFTEESARTYQLNQNQPRFPDVTLEDSQGREYPFSEFAEKYVMLTFVYTECTDVCPQLEMNLADVYQNIPDAYLGEDIVFLTISFDPERDDPETLERYQAYFNSDGELWRMARINNQSELDTLLEDFGVIVIPDGEGGFAHNSAFYLVNKEGVLEEVMDYEQIDEATETVLAAIKNERGE